MFTEMLFLICEFVTETYLKKNILGMKIFYLDTAFSHLFQSGVLWLFINPQFRKTTKLNSVFCSMTIIY